MADALQAPAAIDFGILGPLHVHIGGNEVAVRGTRRRALLARLLVDANHVVTVDELIDSLWDGRAAPGAAATLHSHIGHLRRALGPAERCIRTQPPGYLLSVPATAVDVDRFDHALAAADDAGDDHERVVQLERALGMWRGRPLVEFEGAPWADGAATRLEERRTQAATSLVRAYVRLEREPDAIAELLTLVRRHPLHSALVELLMRALHRAGREAEAHRVFRAHRLELREVGIEPPSTLLSLERAILLHDDVAVPAPRVAGSAPAGEGGAPPPGTSPAPTRRQGEFDDADPDLSRILAGLDGAVRSHLPEEADEHRVPYVAVAHFRQALAQLDATERVDMPLRCELLLRLGESQLRTHYEDHRATLFEAARLTLASGDHERLTRACLALSRSFAVVDAPLDVERVDLLEQALKACGRADSVWRARLLACLAGELQFDSAQRARGGELAQQALRMSRRVADTKTMGAVSGIAWHVMWHPRTLAERSQLSREMDVLATTVGAARMMWQAKTNVIGDALASGDLVAVDEQLKMAEDLAERLDDPLTHCRTFLMRATRASIAGEMEVAEILAMRARSLAVSANSSHQILGVAGLLVSLRLLQGRIGDLRSFVAHVPMEMAAARAVHALIDVEQGEMAAAAETVRRLAAQDFAAVPEDATWPFTLALCAEVGSKTDDVETADVLYRVLLPHAGQHLAHTSYFLGAVDHYLGMAAASSGNIDQAAHHFQRAAVEHRRIQAPRLVARTRQALAGLSERRDAGMARDHR